MKALSPLATNLIAEATKARGSAYAPYSNYFVGAALLDESGRVFLGCNVENVSYSATICAERTAIVKMVCEGGRSIKALALVTRDGGWPCGICLQTMMEFAENPEEVQVLVVDEDGEAKESTLKELLPHAFFSKEVLAKNDCMPQSPLE